MGLRTSKPAPGLRGIESARMTREQVIACVHSVFGAIEQEFCSTNEQRRRNEAGRDEVLAWIAPRKPHPKIAECDAPT